MNFIEYIKSQGYELLPRKGNEYDFSTMGVQTSYYKKDNSIIGWGLLEHGLPPTLVSPRPFIVVKIKENQYHQDDSHATTEKILKEISNERLLEMIETKKLKYESK